MSVVKDIYERIDKQTKDETQLVILSIYSIIASLVEIIEKQESDIAELKARINE